MTTTDETEADPALCGVVNCTQTQPVRFEAVRWTLQNEPEMRDFIDQRFNTWRGHFGRPDHDFTVGYQHSRELLIVNLGPHFEIHRVPRDGWLLFEVAVASFSVQGANEFRGRFEVTP